MRATFTDEPSSKQAGTMFSPDFLGVDLCKFSFKTVEEIILLPLLLLPLVLLHNHLQGTISLCDLFLEVFEL